MSVTITNKKICDFAKKYPDINLEVILSNFIDLIEKFAGNYTNVSEERIIESIGTLKNVFGDINTSNIDNYKSILKLNSYENKDDINKVLSTITNKNTEMLSKNKEETFKLISEMFSKNKDLISKDNEIAFHKMQNILPQDLVDGMKDYFMKNKTSAFKGQQSENKMEFLLNEIFKDGEISNMAKTNHAGDFHLRRENKDTVIIENKDYKANVGFDGVDKFRNDCKSNNKHGVIVSHHSGIATKRDYSVEIFDNKVLVYLTNVDYDGCKILTAVNLIDNLAEQLNKISNITNNTGNVSIDKDTMLEINDELSSFIQQKERLYKTINKTAIDLKESADCLKLPKMTAFFTGKCDVLQSYTCQWCDKSFPTRAGLGSHMKTHATNKADKKKPKKNPSKKEECVVINADESSSDDG